MAVRRRYKSPQRYKDGGRVADDGAPMPEVSADVPLPPASPPDIPPPQPSDAVLVALEGTRRAEELQRQAAQIDALPLSQPKRDLLKANPQMFFDPTARQATEAAYRAALADGVPDDTPEMNERIIEGVRREIELRQQRRIEAARAAMPAALPSMPMSPVEHADRLDREVDAMRGAMAAETAMPMAVLENMENLPAPAPRRQRIPVSAPVSRDVPTASGRRMSDRAITLSPEEREVARLAYRNLPPAEAEQTYALYKSKLLRMRETGEYRRTTEQDG